MYKVLTPIDWHLLIHFLQLLIVDDRIAICGSSNINDRSQLGFHDSELAIVMEDTTPFPSMMDGQPYTAGQHAATLRRMLWREHLGLLHAQTLDASEDPNAQPPGDGDNVWEGGDEHDAMVGDPLNDELWEMWTSRATTNTKVFRHLFHADPDNNVKNFEDYDAFLGAKGSRKAGHLYDLFQPVEVVRQELDKIKGHLVWMPLDFLKDVELAEKGLQVNAYTESIYT
jgi:phospholipase D1/2